MGWPGFGGDESAPDRTTLSLSELDQALTDGMDRAGLQRFDLIGFDACLMATVETALALEPFADYLLAAEELEPGHGWDYRSLQVLRDDPGTDAIGLGRALIDGFDAQAERTDRHAQITLSLTDLSALDALDRALADLGAQIGVADAAEVARQRARTLSFGSSPDPSRAIHMIDLGDFAANLAAAQPRLAGAASAIESAIADAVVDQTVGEAKDRATGLSVYFPPQRGLYDPRYDGLAPASTWRAILHAHYAAAETLAEPPRFLDPDHAASVSWDEAGLTLAGQLESASSVTGAVLSIGVVDRETGTIFVVADAPASVDPGGLVRAGWDTSVLVVWQEERQDYGYLSLVESGSLLQAVVPLAYERAPGAGLELCALVLTLDTAGREVARTLFLITPAGPGELTPEPGSTLETVVIVFAAGEEPGWTTSGGATFDAMLPLDLLLEPLPAGVTVDLALVASDYAGQSDWVAARFEL